MIAMFTVTFTMISVLLDNTLPRQSAQMPARFEKAAQSAGKRLHRCFEYASKHFHRCITIAHFLQLRKLICS